MSAVCNAGKTYGKTVRVPREVDLRRATGDTERMRSLDPRRKSRL